MSSLASRSRPDAVLELKKKSKTKSKTKTKTKTKFRSRHERRAAHAPLSARSASSRSA